MEEQLVLNIIRVSAFLPYSYIKVTSLNFVNTPKSGPYSKKQHKLSLNTEGKLCNVNICKESDGCTDKPLLDCV